MTCFVFFIDIFVFYENVPVANGLVESQMNWPYFKSVFACTDGLSSHSAAKCHHDIEAFCC